MKGFIKRISICLLTMIVTTMSVKTAVATSSQVETNMLEYSMQMEDASKSTYAIGKPVEGEIVQNGTLTLYPVLYNTGLSRTLWFWASSNLDIPPSGRIEVKIYAPDGKFFYGFETTADKDKTITIPYPSTGTYKVEVTSHVNKKLYVYTTWSAEKP